MEEMMELGGTDAMPEALKAMLGGGMTDDPEEIKRLNEEAEWENGKKMCDVISKMDDELKDRFKALKVIQS